MSGIDQPRLVFIVSCDFSCDFTKNACSKMVHDMNDLHEKSHEKKKTSLG